PDYPGLVPRPRDYSDCRHQLVAGFFLGQLLGDADRPLRQVGDVVEAHRLAQALGDSHLHLDPQAQAAEDPNLVAAREQVVDGFAYQDLGHRVEQVVVEEHERVDRHVSLVEDELGDLHTPVEVPVGDRYVDQLPGT